MLTGSAGHSIPKAMRVRLCACRNSAIRRGERGTQSTARLLEPVIPILLHLPDGRETRTSIGTLELPHPNPQNEVLIMLRDLTRDDVRIGIEFWSV